LIGVFSSLRKDIRNQSNLSIRIILCYLVYGIKEAYHLGLPAEFVNAGRYGNGAVSFIKIKLTPFYAIWKVQIYPNLTSCWNIAKVKLFIIELYMPKVCSFQRLG